MDEIVILLLMTCILIFVIIIFPHLGFNKQNTCTTIPIQKISISDNTLLNYSKQIKYQDNVNKNIPKKNNINTLDNMNPVDANIMLNEFYTPALNTVPENYPRKNIGECPYSKKQSTDLPLANVSLCGINKGKPMRLSEF